MSKQQLSALVGSCNKIGRQGSQSLMAGLRLTDYLLLRFAAPTSALFVALSAYFRLKTGATDADFFISGAFMLASAWLITYATVNLQRINRP